MSEYASYVCLVSTKGLEEDVGFPELRARWMVQWLEALDTLHPTSVSGEPTSESTWPACAHHGMYAPLYMHVCAYRIKIKNHLLSTFDSVLASDSSSLQIFWVFCNLSPSIFFKKLNKTKHYF